MKIPVYNQKAEQIEDIEVNPKVFDVKINKHLLAEAVRIQLANARQGSSNTKTRGEVRGGGKKPWKQKGTGRARAGSIRSPIWRHGGVTFGPRANRNWELKINKQSKRQSLFMGLSDKVKNKQFFLIDQINLDGIKTKSIVKILQDFKKQHSEFGKKQLLILPKTDSILVKSVRNIPRIKTIIANSLNIVDVLKADSILALKTVLPVIEKTYLKA